MVRKHAKHLDDYLSIWMGAPTLPLEVSRARYDVPFPRSWEVFADGSPIAEFTEWEEAQEWAHAMAQFADGAGAEVRRYRRGWSASGNWGKVGYFDINHTYREIKEGEND